MLDGEDSPDAWAIEILRQALEQWSSDENLYLAPKLLWSNMTKKPANAHEKWQAPFPTIDVIEQAFQNSQIYPYIYLVENEFLSCHKQPHQLDEIWLLGEDSSVSEEVARILNTCGLNVKITKPYDIMCWGLSGQQKDIVLLVRNSALIETINRARLADYNIRTYKTRQVHGSSGPIAMRDLCRIVFEIATGVIVRSK